MTWFVGHETWFEHGDFGADWDFAGKGLTIAYLAAALLVLLVPEGGKEAPL